MASSDDEGETVCNISEYEFISGKDEPISFTELPVEWNESGIADGKQQQIFLQGKTDNGLRKIYKQVMAWKFDISYEKPQISVLSEEGYWIKLLKPRKAFLTIIRTILITVHFLHFVKWNPQRSRKALWDHLLEEFSHLESRPSERDLVDHMSLINEAIKWDGTLAKSKLLSTILDEKLRMGKAFNEDVKSPFIVDDCENEEDTDEIDESEDDESDIIDDCFDSVCAICDNGGDIILCEGKCMRSFHATVIDGEESKCASLAFTDEEVEAIKNLDFYCKNCEHKQHQCFACGKLGSSDESSRAEVFRCGNGACGHFYHPHCVAKLLHHDNEAAEKEQREKIASGEQFACPVHKCFRCKELEVRSDHELQFAICRRCPRAYHRKCLPRKIAFEKDVDLERNIVQRAWEGLIPNRVLIYCLKHEIDLRIATPVRDHIKFPDLEPMNQKKLPLDSSKKKPLLRESSSALEDIAAKRIDAKPPEVAKKLSFGSKQGDPSRKRVEKLPAQGSFKKQKVSLNRNSLGKPNESTTIDSDTTLGAKLYAAYYGVDSEPVKSTRGERVAGEHERSQKVKSEKRIDNTLTLDTDTKKRIFAMMKDVSSSITLEQIKRRHKSPSTHAHSSKFSVENVTLGKVEGSVQAIRGALKKLDKGGSIKDAKAVCGNDLLVQMMKWKEKLKVYLAPFLYGMRYTSFGRHFTKINKLKEIVDILHWYIEDGDMLVDFCCGSNDFSCLMKTKLDEIGKRCSFKNYDILQAKNDFNFERRDWMGVRPNELPEGSRLIMGLNPPFGVNAALANKFINKSLEFKPKLLILIVPRETERLDDKEFPYDLIWEDDQMFIGKSFYLPGSVDVNDHQIEDWNVNAPVLYLWSHRDWTPKHKDIAKQHGHLSGAVENDRLEESHQEMHGSTSLQECHKHDEFFVNQGENSHPVKQENQGENSHPVKQENQGDNSHPVKQENQGENSHPVKQENQEQEAKGTTSCQVVLPHDSRCTDGDKNHAQGENNSETQFGGKRNRKTRSDNRFLEGNSTSKHPVSLNPSPNVADGHSLDTYSSEHLERPIHIHGGRDEYEQLDRRNSTYSAYSQKVYNGNENDDLVRKYSLNKEELYPSMPSMTSRLSYTPSPNPEYKFRASSDRWIGYPKERTDNFTYGSYVDESQEKYGRVTPIQSLVNIPGRELPESWNQRTEYLSHPGPVFSSSYGHSNPASSSTYGEMNTSAMQRYAARLDEFNHGQMNNVVSRPPGSDTRAIYRPPFPRPGGFAPGPYGSYFRHNSSGWLNE